MNENSSQTIPIEIRLYLNEIAERLWSGHAAVMVGAGFSKNARKSDTTQKNFPDWTQLGNVFYTKIYGTQPNEKQHYLNALKLADEVQAAFGRSVLDQILRAQIPDKQYEPSLLHINLLELPWTDVFTTNYDTLLERASDNIVSQKFDIVICKEDLVYSEKPRIIKLHGSFPSERPFVITEEDYRKYPKDFAPFVNTVQQSLLENTLCLIGFSGDDPNFLQWIGWIQDNLGKDNSPKIYLIGIFNLSHAQKKLLEQRNIVLLDFSVCDGVNGNHEKALNIFFDYLFSAKKLGQNLNWPGNQPTFSHTKDNDHNERTILTIQECKAARVSYPNWVVLPEDLRDTLQVYTESIIDLIYNISKISVPNDLELLYEFNWRIEKCLCPIYKEIITKYEITLERYNPFPEVFYNVSSINPQQEEYKSLPWLEITSNWLELHVAVMRFYREEGLTEKWSLFNEKLKKIYDLLSPELVARLHYERCLCSLFKINVTEVKAKLKEWPVNPSLPFWEAKRAGLLAEIGDSDTAEKLLEQSLSSIRKQLNLSPISNNYLLVSQESYIMQLLQYVNNSIVFSGNNLENRIENKQKFSERWNDLKQFKCDPWNELKLFEIKLDREPASNSHETLKNTFDIGRTTKSFSFGTSDKEAITAYSFLRYCEESGIPFRIQNMTYGRKAVEGALKRISSYSPYWAIVTLIRSGDIKGIDELLNREFIFRMDTERIDSLINDYLLTIEIALPEISLGDRFGNNNFAIAIASVVPEILSRLCVKCSDNSRVKLLDLLRNLYLSEQKHKFKNIKNILSRLINSLSDKRKYELLPTFLTFPILIMQNDIIEREFPDPFYFISFNSELECNFTGVELEKNIVESLIEIVKSGNEKRKKALIRLEKLYKVNLLNEEQKRKFAEALWDKVEENFGFPAETDFYKFAFLGLPYPQTVNIYALFKRFILNSNFPIQDNEKGISITGGELSICHEIIEGTKKLLSIGESAEWLEDEAVSILDKLIEWWNSDKQYLKQDDTPHIFGSVQEEFQDRFRKLAIIISDVIAPSLRKNVNKETKDNITLLLKELDEYGIPCVRAKSAYIDVIEEISPKIFEDILCTLSSTDHIKIIDALYAVSGLCKSKYLYDDYKIELKNIFSLLSQRIMWRRQDSLVSVLNVMGNIVSDCPQLLDDKILNCVLLGLKYLCIESNLTNLEYKIDVSTKLSYRRSAAGLAFKLYKYYSDKEQSVPQAIIDWKNICFDKNEYSEIQNQWLEE